MITIDFFFFYMNRYVLLDLLSLTASLKFCLPFPRNHHWDSKTVGNTAEQLQSGHTTQ